MTEDRPYALEVSKTANKKTANKKAIKSLPKLRASLIWFKRETVRSLRDRAKTVSSPKLATWLNQKAAKVSATELADLRPAYEAERTIEIARHPRFELTQAVPGIVWLSA